MRYLFFYCFIGAMVVGCSSIPSREPRWSDTCVVHPDEMKRAAEEHALQKTNLLASPSLRAAVSASLSEYKEVNEPLIIGAWCYFLNVKGYGAFPSLERAPLIQGECGAEHEVLYTPPHKPGSVYGKIEGLRIDPSSDRIALLLAAEETDRALLAVVDPRIDSPPLIVDNGPIEGVEWMSEGSGLVFTSLLKGRAAVAHSVILIDRLGSIEPGAATTVHTSNDETEVLSLRRDTHLADVILTVDSPQATRELLVSKKGVVALESAPSQRRFTVWLPSGRATLVKSYETGATWIELSYNQRVEKITPPPHQAFREIRVLHDRIYVVSSGTHGDTLTVLNDKGQKTSTLRPSSEAHRLTLNPVRSDLDEDSLVSEESLATPSAPFSLRQRAHASPISAQTHVIRSRDGTPIPITIINAANTTRLDAPRPTLVTGYGAYGALAASRYAPLARALINMGWRIVVVHVRGGGELGPAWHLNGRGERKEHSVSDFVDGASAVRRGEFGTQGPVVWYGKSAGGTLVAAAALQNPTLADGVIIDSGFLDINSVLGTHRDRMTSRERDEWGFPSSIDPCSLAISDSLPPLLIVAGMRDTVVPARHAVGFHNRLLRSCRTCQAQLVLSSTGTHDGELYPEGEEQVLLIVAQFAQSVSRSHSL